MNAISRFSLSHVARLLVLGLALLGLFAVVSPVQAAGAIWYVNDDAAGLNNGTSWANAYTDLQSALSAAAPGDQIWVAAGVYRPSLATDAGDSRSVTFALQSGVALYGGFAGTETSLAQRDWVANVTTLSGDIGVADEETDNAYHVITGSGTDATAILDGFTISGGNADGVYADPACGARCGGGMWIDSGSPSLSNLIFHRNLALFDGGGLFVYDGSPSLSRITFSENVAESGGGMLNVSGSPVLTNVTFNGNQAATDGGGLVNDSGSPALTNVAFSGNYAVFWGGGLYNYSGSPTLTNATFAGNQADLLGGGVYNADGLLLQNSVMWGNSAPDGSEIHDASGGVTIRYSLVAGQNPPGPGNQDGTLPANAPQFVRDPDPGDGDWSTFDDNDYGDLRLQGTSPLIDVGDNAADLDGAGSGTATIAGVAADLAGGARLVALLTPAAVVDLGAYETPNQPPVITTTAITTATEEVLYTYTVAATDADPPGGTLVFSAPTKPSWLTLTDHGDGTATLAGTPSSDQVGPHPVVLTVTDAGGLTATQSFIILVDDVDVNDAPIFTSIPVTTATVGLLYSYAITTQDVDAGDTRTLTAPTKPGWLTLTDAGDGTGTLSGTPPAEAVGTHEIRLRVQDVGGLSTEQSFNLTVVAAPKMSGSVTGLVFADLDGDGQRAATGEPGVPDVKVTLGQGPGAALQTTSGADGQYRFDGVAVGEYTLVFEVPAGYLLPDPPTRSVTVTDGQETTVPDYPLGVLTVRYLQHLPLIEKE